MSGAGVLPAPRFHFRVAPVAPSAAARTEPRPQRRYRGGALGCAGGDWGDWAVLSHYGASWAARGRAGLG